MELSESNVDNMILTCLITEEEFDKAHCSPVQEDMVVVKGYSFSFAISRKRFDSCYTDLIDLAKQLPETLFSDKGPGDSMLAGFYTKQNFRWTTSSATVEALFMLFSHAGLIAPLPSITSFLSPTWLPYVIINSSKLS